MKSIKIARKPFSNPCQLLAKASSRLNSTAFLVFALLIVTPLIVFVVRVTGQSGSALLISEFRVRGPNAPMMSLLKFTTTPTRPTWLRRPTIPLVTR